MSKIISLQALKASFVHYLIAFFLGRLASRIIGKALESLSFGPSAGASRADVLMYFYLSAFVGLVVMALAATWIFSRLKKIYFSISLFVALAAAYSVLGIAALAGMLSGFYPPQAILVVIPIQFLTGWFFTAMHVEKHGLSKLTD
jgi:magnesium-transporting ATPase (P-type)